MAEETQTGTVGDVPPPLTSSGSSNSLTPSVRLRPRKVTSVAEGVVAPTETEYTPQGYVGQGLVNSQGVLARTQYGEDEAYSEIAKFGTPTERGIFLNRLATVGLYGNSKPGSGFSNKDLSAMREALRYANAEGVTVDVAVNLMAADPNVKTKIAGSARVRTTPKQDLRAVFKQAAGSVLGRQLSDAEVEKFVRSYNQAEVVEAMGGAAAPSVQTAALQAVEAASPDEAAAMGALQLANIMDKKIKALG
jgi:hypothetical protein